MSEFTLSLQPTIDVEVKCQVPTGSRNGWRNLTFFAYFEPMSQDQMTAAGLNVAGAMERCVKRVDFGTLKVQDADDQGNALTPLQIALGNVYTYNALLATFRDQVLMKNIAGKA